MKNLNAGKQTNKQTMQQQNRNKKRKQGRWIMLPSLGGTETETLLLVSI